MAWLDSAHPSLMWQAEGSSSASTRGYAGASREPRISAGGRGCDRRCGGYSTRAVGPRRALTLRRDGVPDEEPVEIIPIDEHQLLIFWVQFVVLVLVARLLGALMNRIGQPAVVGELAAGLVLGPTVLGALWPSGAEWLFPRDEAQSAMLLIVAWVGIVMLLILTGFETDLALIRRLGMAAVAVAAGSVIVPFVLGLGTGFVLPGEFIRQGQGTLVFALFIGAALSISSLPVFAEILSELGMTRRTSVSSRLPPG